MKHIFTKANFITETTPMYSDPEGNTPYKVKFETLPEFGLLSYDGIPVTIGQVLDYTTQVGDGKLIYESDLPKLEAHNVNFYFRVSDIGSELYSNIGIIFINIKKQEIPPTVSDNFAYLTNKTFTFDETSFTKDFLDVNGDSYSDVTLKESTNIPDLRLQGGLAKVNSTFLATDSNDLKYVLPDEYAVYDGIIYEFDRTITSIILDMEQSGYKLIDNTQGVLTFGKNGRDYDTLLIEGTEVDSDALCFDFTIKDDSPLKQESNVAEFCLIAQGNINIKGVYNNQPPTTGDLSFNLDYDLDKTFSEIIFVDETNPIYNDVENDDPYKIKIESLPTTGALKYNGINISIGDIFPIENTNKIEYISDKDVITNYTDTFTFRISDTGSEQYSNIGTVTLNVGEKLYTKPTVDDNFDYLTSNKYTFKLSDFTKNYSDVELDPYLKVVIEDLIGVGLLKFNSREVEEGTTILLTDIDKLTFTLSDRYAIIDDVLYMYEDGIDSIILRYEAAGYYLDTNENGVLLFRRERSSFLSKKVIGEAIDNTSLSFHFSVIEDSEYSLKTNIATFSLIPQGNVNVAEPYINQPPTVGNLNFDIEHDREINFTAQNFIEDTFPKYNDIEGDSPVNLMIVTLPTNGELFYKGFFVTVGQIIPVNDIHTLRYVSDTNNTTAHQDEFTFKISDSGSNSYSNIGRITINIAEKIASPPTITDSSGQLVGNQYDFIVNNFTNEFTDLDGDSYNETKIETLPPVGNIQYNGVNLGISDTFPLSDINNVKYILPDSYMLTPTGYCKFTNSIDTIISDQAALGFNLINRTAGRLEFEKANSTRVPNTTDIYAFFDATSMNIDDAKAAQSVLVTWYNNFISTNTLFTGQLYILPVVKENWVDFPTDIIRGSLAAVGNNSDRPNDDFMALAIIPPNFDIDTNNVNVNWIPPKDVLLLAFIDEVDQGSTIPSGSAAYHRNRNGYGFDQQPSTQYLADYKGFVDNHNKFDFFKGVFYPIPNIEGGSYNNSGNACVLQGFAAIEGGATYSLPEITALGVTFANERRFHWHLDINHPNYTGTNPSVANPYSPKASTPVPNTNYNLQGLKNFGWIGVYDKDQPASNVFTQVSFSKELSKFLQGSETSTVERKVIEGVCTTNVNICFDFRTSDDSTFNFFSNNATFCLSPSYQNTPPTVDDNSAPLRIERYTFNTSSFIKNFTDAEGDTANQVIIKSYPNTAGLKLLGMDVQIGDSFSVVNSNNLTFDLNDRYAIYGGVIYDFRKSIQEIIDDYLRQGYVLDDNSNGTLTFVEKGNEANRSVVRGTVKSNNSLCFNFATTDSSIGNMESNIATFCLIPEGDINIKTIHINNPPTIGDNRLTTHYNKAIEFTRADFIEETTPVYRDPENDAPFMLKILSLPVNGILKFDGINVNIGNEFSIADISQKRLTYVPDSTRTDIQAVDFDFTVSDIGSKTYAS